MVILVLCKFSLLRRKVVKPSKIEDDLLKKMNERGDLITKVFDNNHICKQHCVDFVIGEIKKIKSGTFKLIHALHNRGLW